MKLRLSLSVLAGLVCAGAAAARPNGDVIFSLETPTDTIGLWNSGTNTTSTIVTFADPNVRLGGLLLAPDGNLYASDGPYPIQNNSTGRIIRLQNPLSGAPIIDDLTFGNTISNPIGLAWHPGTGGILVGNNPGGDQFPNNRIDGFIHVSTPGGTQTTIYNEGAFPPPRPGFSASSYLTHDPLGSGDYYVTAAEGGAGPLGEGEGSLIYRLHVNNDLTSSLSLVVDLSNPAVTGLPDSLTFVAGITSRPGSNELYVTDRNTDAIYKVLLNNDGTYNTILPVISTGVPSAEVIIYDPFNNKLVFDTTDGIKRVNLDGTGLETIVAGVHARGLAIVPAPGSALGLGLLGLVTLRRRR